MPAVDDLDRRILDRFQRDFPLESDPYAPLAEELGADAETILERVRVLLADGTIRRLGPRLDSGRLGRTTTLVALRVPPDRVAEVAALANRYDEVTHNYERGDAWNLWIALVASSAERIGQVVEELRRDARLRPEDVMELPAVRRFKIDVTFPAR